MNDKRKQDYLEHAEQTLSEIRRDLELTQSTGDVYELRALQLLLEVTKALHSQRDTRVLVTLILDSALSFASAERAFLMLMDTHGVPQFKAGRTYNGEYLDRAQFVISMSVVAETLSGLQPIILADALNDERYSKRQSVVDLELRTIMAAPLRYGDRVLGLIYVDSRRPMARYSRHHLNVLSSLAEQASIAIFNAQKFETLTG